MSDNRPAPETIQRVLEFMASQPQPFAMARSRIADNLGMSETNTARALNLLVQAESLRIIRKGSGPGYPTLYALASPVYKVPKVEPLDPEVVTRLAAERLGLDPGTIVRGSLTIESIPGGERVEWRGVRVMPTGFADGVLAEVAGDE